MNSFGEIRTCLVLMFSAMLIVKTRARFIYHPDNVLHCLEAKIPCSGHRSEDSCKEYCQSNGFIDGHCDASCCLCFSGSGGALSRASLDQRNSSPSRHHHPFLPPPPMMTLPSRINPPLPHLPFLEIHNERENPSARFIGSPKQKRNFNIIPDNLNQIKAQISIKNQQSTSKEDSSVCVTPECVKAAYSLVINMDELKNPCDDFYAFACGNFDKNTYIPDDKPELTLIGGLTEKLHQQIRQMIEDIREDASPSSRLVKNLYDSCTNQELQEAKGTKPLNVLLRRVGGWQLIEEKEFFKTGSFKWTDLVLKLREEGISGGYLLGISVGNDFKNPGKRIITIGEPQLSFGREQLSNPIFMTAYQKYQTDVTVLLGAEENFAKEEMHAVLQFERNLANLSLPREESRAHPLKFYNPVTISELQQRLPAINWLHFISTFLPEGLDIAEKEVVIVSVPPQLVSLFRLIEMTDQKTLVNYLMWRTASSILPYLGESSTKLRLHFNAKVTGQLQKPPKWEECVGLVTTTLAHAVGKLYVQKYFNENSRTEAIKMFQDIHESFQSVLDEAEWMDPGTKERAQEKVNAMRSFIGYPEELLDEGKLMELYDGLEMSKDNFLGNVLNITKSATKYSLSKLRKTIDKDDWVPHGKPAIINAFYSPTQNLIQFPAGIMQGHFFSLERPNYLNFGAIGWVYGHEVIHSLDDQGSRFDLNGDLKEWWHPATKQSYHEKTQCIVKQYSKYNFTDLVTNTTTQLNGVLTQGESIADAGGIKLAYRGYQKWLERNKVEQKLPGLTKYSTNQLFWISAANNWCSKHRPVALHHKMKVEVHPPGNFRVLGSFTNSQDFAKDFHCPVGSKMNPVSKCTVW